MPRKSAEARSALYYQKGTAPPPPAHLDASQKRLWRRITHAYPIDYFQAGADLLLETFVVATTMHRFFQGMWRDDPGNPEFVRSLAMLTTTMNQTAQKLRISNSARLHKRSGVYDETDTKDDGDKNVLLFGGRGPMRF